MFLQKFLGLFNFNKKKEKTKEIKNEEKKEDNNNYHTNTKYLKRKEEYDEKNRRLLQFLDIIECKDTNKKDSNDTNKGDSNNNQFSEEEKNILIKMFEDGLNIHDVASVNDRLHTDFWLRFECGVIRLDILRWLIQSGYLDMQSVDVQTRLIESLKNILTSFTRRDSDRSMKMLEFIIDLIKDTNDALFTLRCPHNGTTLISSIINTATYEYINCHLIKTISHILDYFVDHHISIDEHRDINDYYAMSDEKLQMINQIMNTYQISDAYISCGQTIHTQMPNLAPELIENVYSLQREYPYILPLNMYYLCNTNKTCVIIEPLILMLLRDKSSVMNAIYIDKFAKYIEILITAGEKPNSLAIYTDGVNYKTYTIMDYMKYYSWYYPDSPVLKVIEKHCSNDEYNTPYGGKYLASYYNPYNNPAHILYEKLYREIEYVKDPIVLNETCEKMKEVYEKYNIKPNYFKHDMYNAPFIGEFLKNIPLSKDHKMLDKSVFVSLK